MRVSKIRNSPRIVLSAAKNKSELVQDELLLTDTNSDGFSDNYIVSDYLDGELDDGGQRIFAEELAEAEEFLFTPETNTVSTDVVSIEKVTVDKVSGGNGRTPDIEVYGTTLVNLLGNYGNFETDSNSDGLADGWSTTLLASTQLLDSSCVFGTKSQKFTLSTDTVFAYYIRRTIDVSHKYFVSGYVKSDVAENANLHIIMRKSNFTYDVSYNLTNETVNGWERKNKKITPLSDQVYIDVMTKGSLTGSLWFDGYMLIDLTAAGALDPVRAAKYGVTNWEDLTEAQLEAEIPYFDSVMSVNVEDGTASELTVENRGKNLLSGSPFTKALISDTLDNLETVQLESGTEYVLSTNLDGATFKVLNSITSTEITLASNSFTAPKEAVTIQVKTSQASDTYIFDVQLEEGSVATDYVPPRTDSISIPNTCELHGYAGAFNYIDSNGNYVKNWERADKTTDGAGAFTLSGYASGSKVICRNKTNGEVEVLNAAASITTGWAVTNIEILYQLETPLSSIEVVTGSIKLYQGHNNVLSPDSSIPVAISVVNLNNDVTTSNSIVNIDNIINTASYEWNAGNLTSWSMSGRSFVNLLHDSEAVQNNYSRHFKSLEGNTYFDYLNTTIITGDNTYKFVTNSSGTTASMAVYNLTDLGNLTSLEADTANTLAGMVLYSTATLWEDLPEAILTEMLPPYIAQYTKEYTASYIKPISNTVEHHEIPIDLPLLGLKSYNNVINSDGSGTEYAKISDLSEGSFTHLDEVDDIDYVEIELNYDLSQDLEIPEIGVCWDYSSDVSTLTRRVLDTAVEVVWDYSSDVSTLSRRAI